VLVTDRNCNMNYKLPGTDFVLEKGDSVSIPIYAIHHDKEFFPDPEKFLPERYAAENKNGIKPYAYIPFGLGPRDCIGKFD